MPFVMVAMGWPVYGASKMTTLSEPATPQLAPQIAA